MPQDPEDWTNAEAGKPESCNFLSLKPFPVRKLPNFMPSAHAGHQCSRRFDSRVDAGIQRTAAHSVEHPGKSCAGVCSCPFRPTQGRAPTSGIGVHTTESYVLARGLSAKRLDAPSPRCEIPRKNGRIELKPCTRRQPEEPRLAPVTAPTGGFSVKSPGHGRRRVFQTRILESCYRRPRELTLHSRLLSVS